jgi:hypothetical protein
MIVEHDKLLLVILPAVGAILLEAANPLSLRVIERQSEEAIRKHSLFQNDQNASAVMAKFTRGVTSVTGLAPTGMSVMMAFMAIVHELPPLSGFWWLYGLIIIMIFGALLVGREIFERGFYDMEISRVTVFGFPTITYSDLHSLYIYIMNIGLIFVCLLFW